MKSAVIDVNVFIDLIKLQMLVWLFKIGFQVYTTQEIIDQLNENQSECLKEFIESGQLTVYRLSEKELEEAINLTAVRALELADKSVAWLSVHLKGIVISANPLLGRFCQSSQLEVEGMVWFFDLLIEKQFIIHAFAVQKMEQLLKINRRIPREECEKRIKEWEDPATCVL
jgi:hypothetical protein